MIIIILYYMNNMCCVIVENIYNCIVSDYSDGDENNPSPIIELNTLPVVKVQTPTMNESINDDSCYVEDSDEDFIEINDTNILSYYKRRNQQVLENKNSDSLPNCSENNDLNFFQRLFYDNISHPHYHSN